MSRTLSCILLASVFLCGCGKPEKPVGTVVGATAWEYKVIEVNTTAGPGHPASTEQINKLGADGWEVDKQEDLGLGTIRVTLKRAKK